MKVLFATAPYFRVLKSYNPRISPMLQTLVEVASSKHEAMFLNGDYGTGPMADWMSIFLNWDLMKGEGAEGEISKFVEEVLGQNPEVLVLGLGDIYLPTVELQSAPNTLRAVKLLRLRGFRGRVVGVGFWPTLIGSDLLWSGFDCVVSGRCEGNILEIVEKRTGVVSGTPLPAEQLPMIGKGKCVHPPDYEHDYDYILSSLGCPFSCSFCLSPTTGSYSTMSVKRFVDEVEFRSKEFGLRKMYFADMIFPLRSDRVKEICDEIIRRKIEVEWWCESRTEVDSDSLKMMAGAGCSAVKLGVEFLINRVLSEVNKRQSVQKVIDAVSRARSAGLRVVAYCMLGSLESSEEDYVEALPKWKQLGANYYVINLSCPYYGTKFHRNSEIQNRLKREDLGGPEGNLWLSHFNTDLLRVWGLSRGVLVQYLEMSRQAKKEDADFRKYEAREVVSESKEVV